MTIHAERCRSICFSNYLRTTALTNIKCWFAKFIITCTWFRFRFGFLIQFFVQLAKMLDQFLLGKITSAIFAGKFQFLRIILQRSAAVYTLI